MLNKMDGCMYLVGLEQKKKHTQQSLNDVLHCSCQEKLL